MNRDRSLLHRLALGLPVALLVTGAVLGLFAPPSGAATLWPQSAAAAAAVAGTEVMIDYGGIDPVGDILRAVNTAAEKNGIPDSNDVPGDTINDNVRAFYVHINGDCILLGDQCWELHAGPNVIPGGARGLLVVVALTCLDPTCPVPTMSADATAVYIYIGGILPVAVNEYWEGVYGCPYDNCGEPYSFVRDPSQPPPFSEDPPGSDQWVRNLCPDPYNDNVCQGPYEGCGENFGRAFALMGADARPNYGPMDPRSFVHLDYRYDSLVDGEDGWYYLVGSDQWIGPTEPAGRKEVMFEVIRLGGYNKVPIPRTLHGPPPVHLGEWAYCWDTPPDGCFNYPETNRADPYDVVEFLGGADAAQAAQLMYDEGAYLDGRYAPGEGIIVAVYNGFAADQWGYGPHRDDAAVLVGYAGAVIVGYGNQFASNCPCDPFDLECFQGCIEGAGNPNTLYGLVPPEGELHLDPTLLLEEFLTAKVILLSDEGDRPIGIGASRGR